MCTVNVTQLTTRHRVTWCLTIKMADDTSPDLTQEMGVDGDQDVCFTDLPPELIRNVLSLPFISFRDLASVAQTCTKMNSLLVDDSNDVWREKYRQRWPGAMKCFPYTSTGINWYGACKEGMEFGNKTVTLLEQIWPSVYIENEICYSHFAPYRNLIGEDEVRYFYVKDKLMGLILNKNETANLTLKYHAQRVLRFVRQEYLKSEWKKFRALPEDQQLMENGAIFVAQWCQPFIDITYETVGAQIDYLTEKVLDYMREFHPEHPVLSTSSEIREQWRNKRLSNNKWKPRQCLEIIIGIGEVLCNRLGFHSNRSAYHDSVNSFLNKVLECRQGVAITLHIIVEGIARRLGVRADPRFRGHLVLLWKENFENTGFGHGKEYFLDIFISGPILREDTYTGGDEMHQCPFRGNHLPKGVITTVEVIERMAGGIEVAGRLNMRNNGHSAGLRSALELMFMIDPQNLNYILHLARLYMLYNISVAHLADHTRQLIDSGLPQEVRSHAENILQMFKVYAPQPINSQLYEPRCSDQRSGVLYAVGMVMRHKLYRYRCVITSWDAVCAATSEWKQEMGVNRLHFKDNQPFYNVLVEDGTYRYAAQENLEVLREQEESAMIPHGDIGRFFESFKNGHYIPNHMKEREFPDDIAVCNQFYCPQAGV